MALKESVERTRHLNLLDMEAKMHYRYWTTINIPPGWRI